MAAAELAALRKCERDGCEFKVPNVVEVLKDILVVMANHLAAVRPMSGGSEGGGGGGKSNAPIPQLDENISEVSWTSWKNRFDRWQLSCKISDSAVVNSSVLQGGIMGFNVMGCEGRKELDRFEARKKTRKLRQFKNYNKRSLIKKLP